MSLVSNFRASNFYCMAIAAELSSLTGPPSAADWSAVSVAAAPETLVAAPIAIATAAAGSIITAADAAAVNATDAPVAAPLAAAAGNNDDNAITTSKRVAVLSVISSTAKIFLRAYFEGADWPLNKALPRGAEFSSGPLGDIVKQYCLKKLQVANHLLNYKKGRYLNTRRGGT